MCALKLDQLKYVRAIREGDFSGLPISSTPTLVNLTGSWKFFRPYLADRDSPCRQACPLKVPIAHYARELAAGRRETALALLRQANPLPAVTGRVCPGFCRQACNRQEFDEAIRIGDLERALGDFGLEQPAPASPEPESGAPRVAVIGSGPAGIGAAVFLARAGIKVTIFEKSDRPGGLLEAAIPAYRLPRELLRRELDHLWRAHPGITLECNRPVRAAELAGLQAEFAAVILAIGLPGAQLPAEWRGRKRVLGAVELLGELSREQEIAGRRFLVVGGGNAALDAARSLRRLGKEVEIIYRRQLEQMPAYAEEKTQAAEEGIAIRTETVVGELQADENGLTVALNRAVTDENGAIRPGSFIESLTADFLVAATGQAPDPEFAEFGKTRAGSESAGLLLAGDCAHGAATVAEALASGRAAAARVIRKLAGRQPATASSATVSTAGLETEKENASVAFSDLHLGYHAPAPAVTPAELPAGARLSGFAEIRAGMTPEKLEAEARRCFSCGSCTGCGVCWFFCPEVAIAISPGDEKSPPAALFDLDHCKGCGQCAAICPRGAIEMEEDL